MPQRFDLAQVPPTRRRSPGAAAPPWGEMLAILACLVALLLI